MRNHERAIRRASISSTMNRRKARAKGRGRMPHPSLETIAGRLSEQLRCEQEDLCRPIVQQVTRGKPVAPAALRASLQVSQDELEQRLAKLPPDVEFDRAGNIVGLGVTLVPLSGIGFLGKGKRTARRRDLLR